MSTGLKHLRSASVMGLSLLALLACAPKEVLLEGERLDPRAVSGALEEGDSLQGAGIGQLDTAPHAVPLSLPRMQGNADWGQRGGTAAHDLVNAALGSGVTRIWSAPVGEGNSRRARIGASPVAAGGRVFAMDAGGTVAAFSAAGGALWSADVTPLGEAAASGKGLVTASGSGGGLAAGGGVVYVTTGYSEVLALEAATGRVLWRQALDTAAGGAPALSGDMVYVVTRDGAALALNAKDGKVQWHLAGTSAKVAMVGGGAPAVDGRMVVFPFQNGDLRAVLKGRGLDLWQARVAGTRLGRAYALMRDVTGDPVIAGGMVIAGTSSGRIAAFDAGSGAQLWAAGEGAMGPVQLAGKALFAISDENRLLRLDSATGATVWAADLPYYVPTRKDKKRRDIRVHYGPVLAGNALFVASSDGLLRVFDPVSGAMIRSAALPSGAASAPIVAGQVLYVMGADGQLHAYR